MTRRSRTGLFGGGFWDACGFARLADRPTAAATAPTSVVYHWDLSNDRLTLGLNAGVAFGLSPEALPKTGAAFADRIERHSGEDRRRAIECPTAPFASGGVPFETRYALRLEASHVLMIEDQGRWFADARGRPAFARGVMRVRKGLRQEGLSAAAIEMRSTLLEKLADDVSETCRSRHAVTLIAGTVVSSADPDTAMAEIGRAVRSLLRRGDSYSVYAPDRFALALTSCMAGDAQSAMRRLIEVIAHYPTLTDVSVRLGAACAPDHASEAADLLRRAESALDRALSSSERIALYRETPSRTHTAPCGTSVEDVIDALNGRDLVVLARPMIDSASRRPVLTQAIARLRSADGLPGASDIALRMEEAGLSLLLDGRMLEIVAEHLADDPGNGMILPIARSTLQDGEWLAMLAAHLGLRPQIASRLVVSVPESALADENARGRLDAMKALGIGVALHGFGAGHVSARQLRNLPVDLIAIDGVFTRTLQRSTEERLFLRSLIEKAHQFGIATIAEWVDDEDTARLLGEWGIDYLQGGIAQDTALPTRAPMTARRARRA